MGDTQIAGEYFTLPVLREKVVAATAEVIE
jgi:hypothetical protein